MAVEVLALLPAVVLLWLANYSEKHRNYRIVTQIFLALLVLFVILLGAMVVAMKDSESMADTKNSDAYGYGLLLSGLIALLLFFKPVRAIISKAIDIDPNNWLHATALVFAALLVGVMMSTASSMDITDLANSPGDSVFSVIFQDAFFVITALFGVGWLARRNLKGVAERLGLKKPGLRNVSMSLVYLAMLLLVAMVLGILTTQFNGDSGVLDEKEDPTVQILGGVTVATAILFSLGAGIGEETLFRGAMQPRFGIILTSAIFAALHIQYFNPLQMGSLFIIGLVFGYERKKLDTTACMITHSLYDMMLLVPVALA